MSDTDKVVDLGTASATSTDDLLRKLISQMFSSDCDTSILEVDLDTDSDADPVAKLEIEMRLLSINGVSPRGDKEDA